MSLTCMFDSKPWSWPISNIKRLEVERHTLTPIISKALYISVADIVLLSSQHLLTPCICPCAGLMSQPLLR